MEEKIVKKVVRLLELSKKFTKTSFDIVPAENDTKQAQYVRVGSIICNAACYVNSPLTVDGREIYVSESGILMAKDNKPLSRSEQIMADAKIKADILNEHDEYLSLQTELSEYFNSLNKIIS